MSPVPFGEALRFWLKLGFISFGGPAGQIAIMHRELVEQRRWISERRFLHALNYCMLLPGPEAQQLATYIGWLMHRSWGGIVAGALFVLPSLVLLIALSWVYVAFGQVDWVAGLFYGIKPAVAAIVLQAVWRIGGRTLRRPSQAPLLWGVAIASFVAVAVLHVPFPWVVLGAAIAGAAGGRWWPQQLQTQDAHAAQAHEHVPALIDDHTPTPAHARFSRGGLARVAIAGALLWLVPMALLVRLARLGRHAGAHGLVLHQGRAAHLRRRVRRAALRLPGRGRELPVADRSADDRRPRAGRNHAGPADHGRGLRRLRGRLDAPGAGTGRAVPGRRAGGLRGDVVHLPAVVHLHPGRRAAGGSHARPDAVHRAADRCHGGGGRRDRQPGGLLPAAHRLADAGRAASMRSRSRSPPLPHSHCCASSWA